ncbi:D-glycero-beta-D-manno-heptose 1,7-bisphosphate 7-phosphatase [Thiobacter aerophilum]|uniref:D,D-heptose 1,7-bisphosphate phosphatase n=1 Tax=Thiobacter aerophilum TaxID=3121275 RepID=A0ABV0EE10_9BURK
MDKPAVFLDRDGTLNVEKEYLHRWQDWEWIPGAIDAIRRLNEAGFLVIVTTNQSGIARGYYTEADVLELHRQVDADLARHGGHIDAYYYCPHHPQYGPLRDCDCRKPEPGMLLRAAEEHDIDLTRSYIIGDKAADIEAGLAVGATPILVLTGYGEQARADVPPATLVVRDVGRAVEWILG